MSIINRTLGAGYCSVQDVRDISGLTTNEADDAAMAKAIVDATQIFISDVCIREIGAIPTPDATRKVFTLPFGLLADADADGTVSSADISVRFYYENTDGSITETSPGTVTIQSIDFGVFTTQNALPDTYSVAVDCYRYYLPLEYQIARRAVAYLTAHLVYLRNKKPGNVTRADLTGVGRESRDESRAVAMRRKRTVYLDEYDRLVSDARGMPPVM